MSPPVAVSDLAACRGVSVTYGIFTKSQKFTP